MPLRTAILSDIHGNTPALRAVLEDVKRQQCAQVFFLGDVVNGVDPHGCLSELRTWSASTEIPITCIKGNAEAYLTTPDRGLLPDQEASWNQSMVRLIQWFENHLTSTDLEWIASFPATLRWGDALLVHDSPVDRQAMIQNGRNLNLPEKYYEWFFHGHGVLTDMSKPDWDALWSDMEDRRYTRLFCGHTHIPFVKTSGKKLICNAGSVGMPLDGDPRPAWVMLIDSENEPDITIRRVRYDIDLILRMVDDTPDYPSFLDDNRRDAYKWRLINGLFR